MASDTTDPRRRSRVARRARALMVAVLGGAGAVVVSAVPVGVPVVVAAPPTAQFTDDVNLTPVGSSVDWLTTAGSRLFFIADDGVHGTELWVTDGVAAPTVIDIHPSGSSDPRDLTAIAGVLWFSADDGTHGRELWKSDGTAVGTVLVAETNPTGDGLPEDFVAFDGELYFTAHGPQGRELWHTNGTQVGTASFDIRVGPQPSNPAELHRVDYPAAPAQLSRLWFSAEAAGNSNRRELISIDTDGTVVIELTDRHPSELVSIGETLYLRASEVVGGIPEDLYTVTRAGSVFTSTSLGGQPFNLTVVGTDLYLTNNDPTVGQELYTVTGGALALVEDIRPGAAHSAPDKLMASGSALFFVADDGVHGDELWRATAPDAASTDLVLDIETGSVGSLPADLAGLAGTLVFTARTAAEGREPWLFDGTNPPFLLEDVVPGALSSTLFGFRLVPTRGVFAAGFDPTVGTELLRIPVSPLPTATNVNNVGVFADLRDGTESSFPFEAAAAGDSVVFSANDGLIGAEPYVYDPLAGTTTLLQDISGGAADSAPTKFAPLGSTTLFTAIDDTHGEELWVTDGSSGGTELVEDIRPGTSPSAIGPPLVVDGVAYFAADDGVAGSELWRSDGTAPRPPRPARRARRRRGWCRSTATCTTPR